MCTAFVLQRSNKTILALNRDEFYNRPTSPMNYDGERDLFYGLDQQKEGTWFVTNGFGDFSFVTNIRDKDQFSEDKRSRGELPFNSLMEKKIDLDLYNPCNLISFKQGNLTYQNTIDQSPVKIEEDLFGISNGIHPNHWPKVEYGKKQFDKLNLIQSSTALILDIKKIMMDEKKFKDVPKNTGFDEKTEHELSSLCVDMENYGTVSTTIMVIDEFCVRLYEYDYINAVEFNRVL